MESVVTNVTNVSSSFHNLRKLLDLVKADVDTVKPDDVSYVSSGYAPLSVRLVQAAVKGWPGRSSEALRELYGKGIDVRQVSEGGVPEDLSTAMHGGGGGGSNGSNNNMMKKSPSLALVATTIRKEQESQGNDDGDGDDNGDGNDNGTGTGNGNNDYNKNNKKPVLLVCFIGGVTYMEIAALRFLGKGPTFPYSIMICCTGIINGNTFLQSLS